MISIPKASRFALVALAAVTAILAFAGGSEARTDAQPATPDVSTLAGKVAAVNGTAGLGIRMSAFIEEEAAVDGFEPLMADGATLSNEGSGGSVLPPDVTVNLDTHGAPQNETAIAVDPNDPNRIVGAANDYVTRTWSCTVSGTPCSALGDGYSGTYYSNDGGATWCCSASDPSHLGTLIPGVEHLVGGPYDAGGDPALAFDSRGNVFYAGLGFNRTSAPNTVTVSKGTFDGSGVLSWGAPTFINATSSPSTTNDKEWIAVDHNPASPYRDRVYVTWTRFIFNPARGSYVQSPIAFAYSSDGGRTFTDPKLISGNVLYGQGSRPVVAPNGDLYVFWDASTRLAALDSTYVVKSTDGGASWSKPHSISTLADIMPLRDTGFRVNSYPAAAAAPDGTLYVTWTSEIGNGATSYEGNTSCAYFIAGSSAVRNNCHSAALYSSSSDGGATWTAPALVYAAGSRSPDGYPVTQPDPSDGCTAEQGCDGSTLNAPAPKPIEDVYPAITVAPNGTVYIGSYRGDVVSPWQSCLHYNTNGSIDCSQTGPWVDNTKLDYVVKTLGGGESTLTTQSINTRYNFSGGFIGDYTDIATGSDGVYHALWTDTNNTQTIDWWYGYDFGGIQANQQDVAFRSGS
ncbi:MAG TPA: sialidase family protein [Gaiellaceae bacterium]|nr:sialidase family protein [Gaiellaceae bacterium]